jgi:hypothetical protein
VIRTGAIIATSLFAALAVAADEPRVADFQWQGTLDVTGQAGLIRVVVPGEALARLQSRSAADLRVFDAAGRPVPFALSAPPSTPAAARKATPPLPALPLLTTPPAGSSKGALQVRVEDQGRQQSLWVQLDGSAGASAQPAPATSVLLDTRGQKEPLGALVLQAHIPANLPVRIFVSTSGDLASWTPVATEGRIYRFDGDNAPTNDKLELRAPLQLEGRFLRLDWSGQDGVSVASVTGLVNGPAPVAQPPAVSLPAPRADGASAREWALPFATPIAQLELRTGQPNTLVPVRILGRDSPSGPWRALGQTVVYRLGAAGQESVSAPAVLQRPSVRWLRVEATHGARLDTLPLDARVLFEPLEVVFVAGAAGPYQLVAGRAEGVSAALPPAMLAATTSARWDSLPLARITQTHAATMPPASTMPAWLPAGIDARTAALWAVLVVGVLVLGAVAWSLLKQAQAKP